MISKIKIKFEKIFPIKLKKSIIKFLNILNILNIFKLYIILYKSKLFKNFIQLASCKLPNKNKHRT